MVKENQEYGMVGNEESEPTSAEEPHNVPRKESGEEKSRSEY